MLVAAIATTGEGSGFTFDIAIALYLESRHAINITCGIILNSNVTVLLDIPITRYKAESWIVPQYAKAISGSLYPNTFITICSCDFYF